jgi:hypothetical protein
MRVTHLWDILKLKIMMFPMDPEFV